MNNYAYLDIILTVVVVILVFRGFTAGFVKEFFTFGALAIGLLSAFLLHKNLAEFIRVNYLEEVWGLPDILAFAIVFGLAYMICKIVQKLLSDIIKGMNLSSLDKLLGGILGFAEGIIVICLVLFIISVQPVFDSENLLEGSLFGRILLPLIIDTTRTGIDSIIHTTGVYLPG